MKQIYVTLLTALFIFVGQCEASTQRAQQTDSTKTNLLDADKVATHLQLNATQVPKVSAFIEQIRNVIKQDEENIAEMRARFRSGSKPGLFEKLKQLRQRSDRIDSIESLVGCIKDELTPEQRERFSGIVVPELPKLSPKSLESD